MRSPQPSGPFSPIPEILEELRAGRIVVVVDDPDRENEGDFTIAAEKVTPEIINFMVTRGRGILCLALPPDKVDTLNLPLQSVHNQPKTGTAFTVAIDAREGITTGTSAADRAKTILTAIHDDCRASDLVWGGHVSALRARSGGVLVRPGQTEASVDLARLAGLKPAGLICEVMNDDGTMARVPDLVTVIKKHNLKMCTVAELIRYRSQTERLVERVVSVKLPTAHATFDLHLYRSLIDHVEHLALTLGVPVPPDDRAFPRIAEPILVRVHSECLTGDVFGSTRCDCGAQKEMAMKQIAAAGRGVFLYMRQEGRGIGLENKMRAYVLQDEHGLDTVDANTRLGFKPDERDYGIGAQILSHLGIQEMRLLTNNPKKYSALQGYGLDIVERVPLTPVPTSENRRYLRAKKEKLGHLLPDL
ncbi:MAG: GTP cyclohydrolase II [Planctomycetes bacterium]|nr:GTP cyclohydrolase II [Planctomycetota bacterium]MBI3846290.1 GTP cyclohydrolase II [Planctomycetota bacterium]